MNWPELTYKSHRKTQARPRPSLTTCQVGKRGVEEVRAKDFFCSFTSSNTRMGFLLPREYITPMIGYRSDRQNKAVRVEPAWQHWPFEDWSCARCLPLSNLVFSLTHQLTGPAVIATAPSAPPRPAPRCCRCSTRSPASKGPPRGDARGAPPRRRAWTRAR